MGGRGRQDTGPWLTRFTLKITHATDPTPTPARLGGESTRVGAIGRLTSYTAGQRLLAGRVNRLLTDSAVAAASCGLAGS